MPSPTQLRNSVARAMLGVVIGLVCQGCAALSYGEFSSPQTAVDHIRLVERERMHSWGRSRGDTWEHADFTVTILPHNENPLLAILGPFVPLIPVPLGGSQNNSAFYSRTVRGAPSFLVTFKISPRAEGVVFDPREVELQFQTGLRPLLPVGLWRSTPTDPYGCLTYMYQMGEPARPPIPVAEILGPFETYKDSCFTLLFDTAAPSPHRAFSISLTAIRRGDRSLDIPPIHYTRDAQWEYDLAPPQ